MRRLDRTVHSEHIPPKEWAVEYTEAFERWWNGLDEDEQESVAAGVELLERLGPALPFPYCSAVRQSRHGHLRELRIQHAGRPYRVLYAFDSRRVAMLLIGGAKAGKKGWYHRFVPVVVELRREGSPDG